MTLVIVVTGSREGNKDQHRRTIGQVFSAYKKQPPATWSPGPQRIQRRKDFFAAQTAREVFFPKTVTVRIIEWLPAQKLRDGTTRKGFWYPYRADELSLFAALRFIRDGHGYYKTFTNNRLSGLVVIIPNDDGDPWASIKTPVTDPNPIEELPF